MSTITQTPDEYHDEGVAKVAKFIADTKVCMLTTTDSIGRMVSRPMAVLEVEFDGDLWFVTKDDARKVEQVGPGFPVNVAFASSGSWVSVSGEAEVVRDAVKAKELWGPGIDAWFPEGPESPEIALLKVQAESAEYWDTPGGAVTASVLSFVKSRVTGKALDVENKTVSL